MGCSWKPRVWWFQIFEWCYPEEWSKISENQTRWKESQLTRASHSWTHKYDTGSKIKGVNHWNPEFPLPWVPFFPFGGSTDEDISEFSLNNIGVENELDQLLSRFYRLDEMPKTRQPTYEESFCEETFEKAHFIEMRLAGISCTYR